MKIPKAELKKQRQLLNLITTGTTFTEQQIDLIYEEFNPAMIDSISENGVYFTPYGLAQDCAVMASASGHIVDVCAGIGMLSYRLHQMDTYNKKIKSITCIELNPQFVEIGKKLLPEANWICGNAYDKALWDNLVKDLPGNKYDLMVSNPPFGNHPDKEMISWLNYKGVRDLMVLELCLRFSESGYFILPNGSVPFQYSGRQYYEDNPERYNRKLVKFIKDNSEFKFAMSCDGIDCSIYRDEWKNLNGIGVEAVNVQIHPYYLDDEKDSITLKV